jgi:hypothetical protein
MRRRAAGLCAAAGCWTAFTSVAFAAEPVTAEEAMGAQRRQLQTAIGAAPCPDDATQIVVCGRRDPDRYRLPLPSTQPGDRVVGELPSAVALTKEETCTNVGTPHGCPHFDLLAIGLTVAKIVAEKVVKKAIDD